jgi:hypothetical protein
MDVLHATEVSFRLGPGTVDDARAIAARLGGLARGCRDDMLFLDAEQGVYGYLALWAESHEAEAYAALPAVREQVSSIEQRIGKPPAVRRYTVEKPGDVRDQ